MTRLSKKPAYYRADRPYILRSRNEAGWGRVPQVLFLAGQPLTMALYHSAETPQMWIYSEEVIRCYPKGAGGCRTNVAMTINELDGPRDVREKSHEHLIIVVRQSRAKTEGVLLTLRYWSCL